ncbi:hypothetical protein A8B75_01390 [Sphingomonadales bacterium EhC05]|nr:hypothetical protein A8B75_01390 [Sphingomonadales bacterium EhC05]
MDCSATFTYSICKLGHFFTVAQFALSQLDKYPDLEARFADLRPVDLKLSYKFGLGFNDSMNGLVNQTQGLQTPHFYTAQNHADGKKSFRVRRI